MRKVIVCCCAAIVMFGCGGGSGGTRSRIEGTWRGNLFQGVLSCADGTLITACGGCVVKSVEFFVSGDDEIGSLVEARDGDCLLQGQRTADGFQVAPVTGCEASLSSVVFSLLMEESSAGLAYQYDIDKIEVEPGSVPCVTTPSGIVYR